MDLLAGLFRMIWFDMKLLYYCHDSDGTPRFAFRDDNLISFERVLLDYVRIPYPKAIMKGCFSGQSFGQYRFEEEVIGANSMNGGYDPPRQEVFYHQAIPFFGASDLIGYSVRILVYKMVPIAAYLVPYDENLDGFIKSAVGEYSWEDTEYDEDGIRMIQGTSGRLMSTTISIRG